MKIRSHAAAFVAATAVASFAPLAQAAPTTSLSQPPPAPAQTNARLRPLETVLAGMTRTLNAPILADSSLTTAQAPLPETSTTEQNVESQLDAVVASLPKGTVWAKVMLPAPPTGKRYRADDIAEYLTVQARLFGNVGAPAPGRVEVLGQKLETEKAAPVVSNLNLKPYYILSNPSAKVKGDADFSQMTPEQQQKWAENQAQQIMNMSPDQRQKYVQSMMGQQATLMSSLIRSIPPDQRQQFFQGMFAGMGEMMRGLRGGFLQP